MTRVLISWDTVRQDAFALAVKLGFKGRWSGIVAVTRGGLIPAALLAHRLNIKIVDTFCIATYADVGVQEAKPTVLKGIHEGWGTQLGFRDLLIVDDLVDHGTTAKTVKEFLPGAHFACLYAKPEGKAQADTYVREYDQEQWIDLPWEVT